MIKELWKNSAIIAKRNVDSNQTPISLKRVELKQIIDVHSCVVLNELPDEPYGIEIDGFTEAFDLDKVTEKSYKVDYANGVIYFHPFNMGKVISVEYYGTGCTLLSASRIFTKYDKWGNVIETLEELLEKGKLYIKAIESLGKATQVIEKLDNDIEMGGELHNNLVEDIVTATPLQADLREDIDEANTFRTQLNKDVAAGTVLNTSLRQNVIDGENTNEKLISSLDSAQESVRTIRGTGNENKIITSTSWTLNSDGYYEHIWIHNLNSTNIIVAMFDNDTKESLNYTYQVLDKDKIKILSDVQKNVKVVLSVQFYNGGMDTKDKVIELTSQLDTNTQQKGTTSKMVLNANGKLEKVIYTDSKGNIVREDIYSYNSNTVTEVIKLNGIVAKTININTETKIMEVF